MGLWKAGIVNAWGISAQDDMWKWESIFMRPPPDVLLRTEVMAASLGATYYRIEANGEFLEEDGKNWRISDGAMRHRALFHALVRNGVVDPVRTNDQVIVSPTALQIKYDRFRFTGVSNRTYWQNIYKLKGPLAYRLSLQAVDDDYVPGYIYDMTHGYDGLFPKTPNGLLPLVPEWINPNLIPGVTDYWIIDGQSIFKPGAGKLPTRGTREEMVSSLHKNAEGLPFQADGVFMAINRFPGGYKLYLMDPGYLDVSDIHTTLKSKVPLPNPKVVDAISGEILSWKKGEKDVRIPAGAFRILEIPCQNTNKKRTKPIPR